MAVETTLVPHELTTSIQNFAIDFTKNVANEIEGDYVISALSVFMVLSMARYGAKDTTALKMHKALRLPENDVQNYQGFRSLYESLNKTPNVTLKLAHKIYTSKNFNIKNSFKEHTRTYFHSESSELDFTRSYESAAQINEWCKIQTNGKISEIVTKDDLKPNSGLLLLSAIYFKGDWLYKFDKTLTTLKPFHISKSKTIKVPTMFTEQELYYAELENLPMSYVGIPYKNKKLLLLVIVPKEIDGLKNIQKDLNKFVFTLPNFKQKVQLSLPKFRIETSIHLESALSQMGMSEIFSDEANFEGISDQKLKVDSIIQKAFIEVNEEGSEAAAITGVHHIGNAPSMPSPPIIFNVDRPFLYQLVDTEHQVTLFSGRVTKPEYH